MSEFKIGDKVRCIKFPKDCCAEEEFIEVGNEYTIKNIEEYADFEDTKIEFENQINPDYVWPADCFQKIEIMSDEQFKAILMGKARMLDL